MATTNKEFRTKNGIVSGDTISATGLAGALLSSTNPVALGSAGPGTSTIPSRQDHVHPTTGLMTNPMTTLGDVLYGGASGTPTRLAGDTSNSNRFLRSVSAGGVAAAPTWAALTGADIASGTIPSAVLGNSSVFIGTTSIALNRGTGALTLAGITLTDGVLTNIVASTGTAADLWSEVTTGSITIGTGLTSGALNLATGGTSATPIGIGHTNATLTMTGASLTTTIPLISLAGVADTATAATHYFVETATDGYIRPKTLANVKTEIVTTAAVDAAAATTVGTVTSGTWNAGVIPGQYGGTGVANTGKTLTISGNTSIGSSTHTVTLATSGNTSVTLPASGTLEVTGHTHAAYATDSLVVHLAGSETITGQKTFQGGGGWDDVTDTVDIYLGNSASGIGATWGGPARVYGYGQLDLNTTQGGSATRLSATLYGIGVGAVPSTSGTMNTNLGARRIVFGDTDTGIGQVSDGVLAIYTNDVERLGISSQGVLSAGSNRIVVCTWEQVWSAPASTTYYKIATLPVSSGSTYEQLFLDVVCGSWDSGINTGKTVQRILLGQRGGFVYKWEQFGGDQANVGIVTYLESDNTISVYAVGNSGQYVTLSVEMSATLQVTTYPVATSTTSPTGTLNFNTRAPSTYKPLRKIDNSGNETIRGRLTVSDSLTTPAITVGSSAPGSPVTGDLFADTSSSAGAFASYTPTLGGTGWALGNGTITGKWIQIGRIVYHEFGVWFGSTSTYGSGGLTFSLPSTPGSAIDWSWHGTGYLFDTGTRRYNASGYVSGTTFYVEAAAVSGYLYTSSVTSAVPHTWANTDAIVMAGMYRV